LHFHNVISFSCFGFVVFVPGNPKPQTVSHSFPKVCAALQKKLRDQNHNRYQLGLKALRLCLVDAVSSTCSRRSVSDA
jgi:hypothetical protein